MVGLTNHLARAVYNKVWFDVVDPDEKRIDVAKVEYRRLKRL